MAGRLSVVATPIGCLEDITLRALRVLREADAILAEDTRHTRALCTKHGIDTPLRSFHAHSKDEKVENLVGELANGAHFALVSDAGTPVVSDPGVYLVARAAQADVQVEVIPGPSAVLAALSVAGLPVRRFRFEGFLPRGGGARRQAIERIAKSTETVVLFESPHRIHGTLAELEAASGSERQVAICRELTKMHEQTIRGTIAEARQQLADPARGEITVVIDGAAPADPEEGVDVDALVTRWQKDGLSTKEMSQRLQEDYGWKRNRAYRAVLDATQREST